MKPRVYAAIPLCLEGGAGPADITDVAALGGQGGVNVQAWAVQPWGRRSLPIGSYGTLEDFGLDPNDHVIPMACNEGHYELTVQLVMAGGRTSASSDYFDISYMIGHAKHRLTYRLGIGLNAP